AVGSVPRRRRTAEPGIDGGGDRRRAHGVARRGGLLAAPSELDPGAGDAGRRLVAGLPAPAPAPRPRTLSRRARGPRNRGSGWPGGVALGTAAAPELRQPTGV